MCNEGSSWAGDRSSNSNDKGFMQGGTCYGFMQGGTCYRRHAGRHLLGLHAGRHLRERVRAERHDARRRHAAAAVRVLEPGRVQRVALLALQHRLVVAVRLPPLAWAEQ